MPMDFYYFPPSPPCRAVLLLAKKMDLELNLKTVNVMAGEHLAEDYMKINPQHTIPTINDDGFILWESCATIAAHERYEDFFQLQNEVAEDRSRAIMTYMVNQYGKNDSLYPRNPKKRALVDQRLYFDVGTLYSRIVDYMVPVLFAGQQADPSKLEKIHEALGFLNQFLEGEEWVAGDVMTVADVTLVVSVSNAEVLGATISEYSNIERWYTKMKTELPGYQEINQSGANAMGEAFHSKQS